MNINSVGSSPGLIKPIYWYFSLSAYWYNIVYYKGEYKSSKSRILVSSRKSKMIMKGKYLGGGWLGVWCPFQLLWMRNSPHSTECNFRSICPNSRPLPTLPFPSLFKFRKFHNTLTWQKQYETNILIWTHSKWRNYSTALNIWRADLQSSTIQSTGPKSFVILKVKTGNCYRCCIAGLSVDTGAGHDDRSFYLSQPTSQTYQ